MSSSATARLINDSLSQKLASADGKEKLAQYGGSFIRDRLREVSFARKILPPENVTRTDCQRSTENDTLVKLVELEPQSRAMALSFRAQPTTRIIRASRAPASFFTISSEVFQKTEQELLAYEMPITKIIEENSVKDIQEIEDRQFLIYIEAGVQALQTEANGGVPTALNWTNVSGSLVSEVAIRKGELARVAGADDATVRPMQRTDIVNAFKMIDGNRMRAKLLLFTEMDFDDVLQWTVDDNGDRIQSETTVEGYKYNQLLGRPFVRTIKTDILRPGNVYVFTDPSFLGKFYILNNTKFYIDKVANKISFQAWEDIAIMIANIAAVRKIELYSADANPSTNANGLLANFVPKAEADLGAANNRVDSGLYFPTIVTY